jgi:hypothetical protein
MAKTDTRIKDITTHNDDTINKVIKIFLVHGLSIAEINDIIDDLQNVGILFRERL